MLEVQRGVVAGEELWWRAVDTEQSEASAGTAGEWQRDLQQKCRDQA